MCQGTADSRSFLLKRSHGSTLSSKRRHQRQAPEEQACDPEHTAQVLPSLPHAEVADPDWHVSVASQQPAQFKGPQLLVRAPQVPAVEQTWVDGHVMQSLPPAPQAVATVPA